MRLRNIFVLLVLFFGLIGANALAKGQDADDYGKLVGWILDPNSGKPVDEVFIIELFNCSQFESSAVLFKQRKTDKKGYFSIKANPGQYCLHISPNSMQSKYCIEPYHFHNDQFYFPVIIENGKITEIRKKATFGGAIKVRVLDTSGSVINPSADLPKGAEISVSIDSPNYIIGTLSQHVVYDDMDDGETTVRTLFPSKYNLQVRFSRTGYKNFNFENVLVKEKEVTEIDCVIDLNDITGIEGKVVDINGNPIKGIEVSMIPQFAVGGSFDDRTDKDGYYQITGLPEGSYNIMISSREQGLRIYKENIEIKKGILTKKHIVND
ncbi:MAG: carboxypeptidase-like regulatory domain-containing protein [Candidatus Aminicenantes bacterium]|jgi:hypothetical protein